MAALTALYSQRRRRRGTAALPVPYQPGFVDENKDAAGKPYLTPSGVAGFTPWNRKLKPPPGSYDPQLDAQERAAGRGLSDLILDTDRSGERASSDYAVAQSDVARSRDQRLEDLVRDRTRAGADFAQGRQRGTEDYNRNVEELGRRYANLATTQAQRQRQAGVAPRGGALAQSLRKRTANQAFDKAPIDTGFQRFLADTTQRETRFGEDSARDEARTRQGADIQLGKLGVQHGRGTQDRETALARAKRENTFFGQDIAESRAYQAAGTGYKAPTRPKGEFVSPSGAVYREYRAKSGSNKGQLYYVLPDGTLTKKKPL